MFHLRCSEIIYIKHSSINSSKFVEICHFIDFVWSTT